jgi:hypothetical protein
VVANLEIFDRYIKLTDEKCIQVFGALKIVEPMARKLNDFTILTIKNI